MKKLIVIFILFTSLFNSWSQELNRDEYQKSKYEDGFAYLESNHNDMAIRAFFSAYKINRKSEIGLESFAKIDSLKPIVRNELIKAIQGEWKLKIAGTNWGMHKLNNKSKTQHFLVIKNNTISFFEKNRDKKVRRLIKEETIVFYDKTEMFPPFNSFVFSDNQIWHFSFHNSELLNTIHTGEKTKNGRTEIVCGNSQLKYERLK